MTRIERVSGFEIGVTHTDPVETAPVEYEQTGTSAQYGQGNPVKLQDIDCCLILLFLIILTQQR